MTYIVRRFHLFQDVVLPFTFIVTGAFLIIKYF